MKRKTNLFYTQDTDSNFITFSNYTEALTGNFLATNVKLFPSKFLCLNINITKDTREAFIKYLAAHYENKMAFLRDKCLENNYNVEAKLKPLGYLLDAIYEWDTSFTISHLGLVTEQDYNGIYADTICVIDASEHNACTITRYKDRDKTLYEEYPEKESADYNKLYNWFDGEEYIGPEEYNNIKAVVDDEEFIIPANGSDSERKAHVYFYSTGTKKINSIIVNNDITFNCIIPLFDIINVDKNQNTDNVEPLDEIICDENDKSNMLTNIPYGIWFAKDTITLTRDDTDYSPSWSLTIGSQFKPFPYSKTKVSEVDQSQKADAFMTFSQILARQNDLISKMMKMTSQISSLTTRVADVESNLKSYGTSYNIDGLHKEIIDLQKQINELK